MRQSLDESLLRPLGRIASEFSSDLALVQDGISVKVVDFFRHAIFTAGALVAIFYIDFRMTLFALVAVLLVAGVVLAFMRSGAKAIVAVQQQRAKLVSVLVESASNAYVIQAFGRIQFMEGRFAEELRRTFERIRKHALLMAAMSPVSLIVFSCLMVVAIAYGIEELRAGRVQLVGLLSYFTYALMLISSVTQVNYIGGQIRQAGIILLKHEESLRQIPALPISELRCVNSRNGKLLEAHFRSVTYSYSVAEKPALSEISFSIPAGSVTGVSGESGAGKSTVVGVLANLLKPQAGCVETLQGGAAVTSDLRLGAVAIVPQEPFPFAGTFFENITFGREGISRNDVIDAAIAARIHEDIQRRQGGYDSSVEEGGRNLSRGQRQWIAIARALVGKPVLLILDEATSSLDVASERAIRAIVEELQGKITIVIVAHQGELLKTINHLVTLDHGRVSYEGAPSGRLGFDTSSRVELAARIG